MPLVNIGSGNGLVPSGNKPLPGPLLKKFYDVTRPQWVIPLALDWYPSGVNWKVVVEAGRLEGCHRATQILVNIGSGNGLLPDGTKPLPEPILTYHY